MRFSPVEESLLRAIEEIGVVDAHEHLPPEKIHLGQNIDLLTLFDQYVRIDLLGSGMTPEYRMKLHDPEIPVRKRWKMLVPYLKNVRHGSFTRAAFISIKEFYGYDEVNENNCETLSKQISDSRIPRIYRRILCQKCNIEAVLTCGGSTNYELDFMMSVMPLWKYAGMDTVEWYAPSKEKVEKYASELGRGVKSLDDYVTVIRQGLEIWKSKGVVGIKAICAPYEDTSKSQVAKSFNKVLQGRKLNLVKMHQLYCFLLDEMCEIAADLELVVAVHTGGVGAGIQGTNPQHMIPIITKHRKTKFDLYHAGIPYFREISIMAKIFPNMWLNMCWAHLISPKKIEMFMDELIDLVPMNKIIAFGGDCAAAVENIYGSLRLSRESVAKVLGSRIEESSLTKNEALEIAKKWYHDNPKEVYQLRI